MTTAPKTASPEEPYQASLFAALRHRNYRLWFFGQMISQMGTWMQSVAQGWVVYQLTGSEFLLGTISFIGSMPTLFLMLPAGVVADRIPKRKVLLATQTVFMTLAFILALLAATGVMQVWHIIVLAGVHRHRPTPSTPRRASPWPWRWSATGATYPTPSL